MVTTSSVVIISTLTAATRSSMMWLVVIMSSTMAILRMWLATAVVHIVIPLRRVWLVAAVVVMSTASMHTALGAKYRMNKTYIWVISAANNMYIHINTPWSTRLRSRTIHRHNATHRHHR